MSQERNPAGATSNPFTTPTPDPNTFPASSQAHSTCQILFCTWHGNMSSKPARLIDLTSALPTTANNLPPKDLIEAAQSTYANLPTEGEANERYRATKSGMFNFTITTGPPQSTPLAKFHVPFNTWASVPITFLPRSNPTSPLPQQTYQQTLTLARTGIDKIHASRTHSFVHNSNTYTWAFPSGMEMHLLDGSRILAKFHYVPSWFRSSGVLVLSELWNDASSSSEVTRQQEQEQEQQEWERVVVVTLIACLRREREWRYAMAGFVFPMKRSFV